MLEIDLWINLFPLISCCCIQPQNNYLSYKTEPNVVYIAILSLTLLRRELGEVKITSVKIASFKIMDTFVSYYIKNNFLIKFLKFEFLANDKSRQVPSFDLLHHKLPFTLKCKPFLSISFISNRNYSYSLGAVILLNNISSQSVNRLFRTVYYIS